MRLNVHEHHRDLNFSMEKSEQEKGKRNLRNSLLGSTYGKIRSREERPYSAPSITRVAYILLYGGKTTVVK